ncbi:alpha/beta fold hydrolase [Mycobacterium sp. ML4]
MSTAPAFEPAGVGVVREERLSAAGVTTRALRVGAGPPRAVLLHGFADGADAWRPVLQLLGRAGLAAIALDLPGFALADPLQPDRAILPQLDTFLDAVLHELPADTVVGGHSLGGCVALRAAARGRTGAVVVVSAAGLDMAPWFDVIGHRVVAPGLIALAGWMPIGATRWGVRRSYPGGLYADPRGVRPDVVAANVGYLRDRATARRLLADGRRLLSELRSPFDWPRIECPVVGIWGERDRLSLPSSADRLQAALPHADVRRLTACGHMPMVERPGEVAGVLERMTS